MTAWAWTRRLQERVVDLSVQAILIVFAVLLALGAEEWWDERELLGRAAEARLAVEAEIEGNLRELEAAEAGLTAGIAAVDELVGMLRQGQRDGVGIEVFGESLVELDLPYPRISTAAWRVAQTSRAAPYLEYGWLIERATLYDSFERYAMVWDWIVEDAANVTGIAEDDMDVALAKARTLQGHLVVLGRIHIGLQERITEHLGRGAATPTLAAIASDDSRVRRLTLRDGRMLVYAEYGDPAGAPVVELHGGGANHLSGVVYHRDALAEGVRVISVSRPGVGGSAAHKGFAVATYHEDFVQLLDALELSRVVVMGNSNGGMFALALAHALPERIAGAMPLNPATPVFDDGEAWTLTPIYHGLAESGPAAWVEGTRELGASLASGSDEEIAAYRASDPYRAVSGRHRDGGRAGLLCGGRVRIRRAPPGSGIRARPFRMGLRYLRHRAPGRVLHGRDRGRHALQQGVGGEAAERRSAPDHRGPHGPDGARDAPAAHGVCTRPAPRRGLYGRGGRASGLSGGKDS